MKPLDLDCRFEPREHSQRVKGLVAVLALHVVLGYLLVSGMARQGLNDIRKPLEAVVIQEVTIAPPPPPRPEKINKPLPKPRLQSSPPPFVPPPDVVPQISSNAPLIASVAAPTTAPAEIAAPPAPAPSPVVTGPKRTHIGLVCPRQVTPEMPRLALRAGIEGVVKAQIHVKGDRIVAVTILSGPDVFHAAVKAAMEQYTCRTNGDEVIATQEFNFKLE